VNAVMTSRSNLANLQVSENRNGDTHKWFDVVNAISLTLATMSSLPLLAITIGSLWKLQ
jgi:hypothetical protein